MADRDPITGWFVKTKQESTYSSTIPTGPMGGDLPPASFLAHRDTETITWSGNGPRAFHSCIHTREREGVEGGEGAFYTSVDAAGHIPYGSGDARNQLPVGFPSMLAGEASINRFDCQIPEDEPVLNRLDWGGARSHLFQDINGSLPIDISIPLNIVEFGQLKRLVPNTAQSINRLVAWCKHGPYRKAKIRVKRFDSAAPWRTYDYVRSGYYEKRVSLESLRWGLKDLSSSYLATTFGLRPLIDDVTNWMTKYYQVKLKSDWYKLVADGKPHTIHASTAAVTSANSSNGTCYVYAPSGAYSDPWRTIFGRMLPAKGIWEKTAIGVLGCRVSIHPKSPMAQASAALSSVLGVNAPLSTVWDVIPFSFVADWFYPFGETIKRVDERMFGGAASRTAWYQMHEIWHSIRTDEFRGVQLEEVRIPAQYMPNIGVYLQGGYVNRFRSGHFTHTYERHKGWPNISILPNRKEWSIFASITSGALTLQRVLR